MWLFTKAGFFSIVEKDGDKFSGYITVRARVRDDLLRLKALYMPELTESSRLFRSDYPYRGRISKKDFAEGMKKIVMDINYNNFKDEIKKESKQRAWIYSIVWKVLLELKKLNKRGV